MKKIKEFTSVSGYTADIEKQSWLIFMNFEFEIITMMKDFSHTPPKKGFNDCSLSKI